MRLHLLFSIIYENKTQVGFSVSSVYWTFKGFAKKFLKQQKSKTCCLDHQGQQKLLMMSVPLMVVMNSSNILRTYTPKNMN